MAMQTGCCSAAAVLLLLVVAAAGASVAGATYVRYKDPKQPIQARVEDLLGRMRIEEKIGQMTQIERHNASSAVIEKYFVGSVLSGGGSAPSEKASAATWQEMITKMQKAALSTRLGIPIIYGIDAVHGNNNAYNATIFPHNVGLGATRDPDLVKRIGRATALEARATGIPYTFAPCVAVCRDPRWGGCYESFSEDTKLVQLMTSAVIPGLQGDVSTKHPRGVPFVGGSKHVAACAKHFVGDGGTHHGISGNNTVLSFHDLMRIHMPPYYDAVIKGVASVMISYSSWNGVKMHENKYLITQILKEKMHFRCGGWTKSWQGQAGNGITGHGTTILEAIKSAVDKKTVIDYSEHPDKGNVSKNEDEYDYAVVVVGEHPYAATAGDNLNLTIPGPGPEVIRKVCELVKCVVVLVSGRPLVVEPYLDTIDALVAAWLPGTEGHGVADVLFGDHGFSGKLPRTWVRSVDQLPMNYGDKLYDPLFPFGFGLTTKPADRS
ncbi:uncharacterized protein [Aegilops tauschii subsp. strangulata]|uniref:uncharacterized protein n=1 Tax=Aegilops tauschii subsp. strangulata TaxID=200361 RepID=UPI001ABD4139|nr:beta-glucosidase BoGH3B-like [Aegilops tauschii subsp. strangulata]